MLMVLWLGAVPTNPCLLKDVDEEIYKETMIDDKDMMIQMMHYIDDEMHKEQNFTLLLSIFGVPYGQSGRKWRRYLTKMEQKKTLIHKHCWMLVPMHLNKKIGC